MTTTIPLLPKQLEFLRATEREVLYSGAYGARKTRALCYKLATRAQVPKSREAVCRKTAKSLKATTLLSLLEGDGEEPPVLPRGSYTHNKQESVIRIHGGGEIRYFGLDDPDKIGSYNVSGVAVDEVVETTEQDYTQLRGRIRLQAKIPQRLQGAFPGAKKLPNQIYGACNPGPPSHYLAVRFGLAGGHQAAENCRALQTNTPENFFLDPDYIADLATLEGLAYRRFYLGEWAGSEGLVYDTWDREIHVRDREGPWARTIIACDDGYKNPMAAALMRADSDGRVHVEAGTYRSGLLMPNKVAVVRELAELAGSRLEEVVVDPSAADLIAALDDAGFSTKKADNAVFDGIVRVQSALGVQDDGAPRLTVSPEFSDAIREFETYEWKPNTGGQPGYQDVPRKQDDHAMDAIRYGVAELSEEAIGLWAL
jgi:phage terminase large subunit